jgi:FtsP/CotA-like multicopper oxidase with cupredoxin domain
MRNQRIEKTGSVEAAPLEDKETGQPISRDLTRRTFITAATASVAALAAARIIPPGILRAVAAPRGGGAVVRNALHIPPVTPVQVPPGTFLPLWAAPATVDLGGEGGHKYSSVLAYNGTFPGPTLIARQGDVAAIRLHNGLTNEPTITHWHGMVVPTVADGHPLYAIAPGATYDYEFQINQRACLNFYHPHPHMLTGKQVNLGLAGGFIVRDAEEDNLHLPSGVYEVPLILRDASFDSAGNLTYNPTSSGFFGKTSLVNGTLNPKLNVDRGVYRFRVLNGSNARVYRIALSNGAPFTVIGNDGGLLESAVSVSQIEFGPGERLDLLVDFSGLSGGNKIMLRDLAARWDLIEFVGTGNGGYAYTPPSPLSTIVSLSGPTNVTRLFSFEGMHSINGLRYEMNRIDFQVPFGVTERWRFTTKGNAPHPVHVHGASFQVVSRSGGRGQVFPWERGWKDTVLLNDKEAVEVLIRFDQYRSSLYLLHCHQLEHEDQGMMSNFEVV